MMTLPGVFGGREATIIRMYMDSFVRGSLGRVSTIIKMYADSLLRVFVGRVALPMDISPPHCFFILRTSPLYSLTSNFNLTNTLAFSAMGIVFFVAFCILGVNCYKQYV